MAIPISYNIRNLRLRKGLTLMTALGIALTVTTAIFLMALVAGLNRAFVSSGNPLNVLVLRKGSEAELVGRIRCVALPHAEDSSRHRQRQSRRADGLGRVGGGDRPSAQRRHRRSQRHRARHDARRPGDAADSRRARKIIRREIGRGTLVSDRTARSGGQQVDSRPLFPRQHRRHHGVRQRIVESRGSV